MRWTEGWLAGVRRHKAWAWFGLLAYACLVTFPHEQVQKQVALLSNRYTHERVWRVSVGIALCEAVVMMVLFSMVLRRVRGRRERRWLAAFWALTFVLLVGTWRMFMANNTELVHYPQYFPEGMALLALTGSSAESLAWITVLGGLDEAFQYTFLVAGRPLPFDFNDVYMDVVGGAAGVVFALALLGCVCRPDVRGWTKRVFARPGIKLILGIIGAGFVLLATHKMVLYETPDAPRHWFALSRLRSPEFWYFSPLILGPHHFHEMTPVEGPIVIVVTIAIFALLDRTLDVSPALRAVLMLEEGARSGQ